MILDGEAFPAFYEAVNGFKPFPWQSRLVREIETRSVPEVESDRVWPTVLDLPTSAGKTSALDAAVFLLAQQAGQSVHERKAALRTFFVVDRRIVVDEAADKARKLARLLNAAGDEPNAPAHLQTIARELRRIKPEQPDPLTPDQIVLLRLVASRLRQFGGEKALHVSVLRGGMYRDGSWAESPTQPTICLSTVDQVGSRLLFRGYGVSPYQRAVHAGLVGNDALILVDEAHLSRPFLETLKAVEFYRSDRWAEPRHEVKTPFQVVVMSATAGSAVEPVVKPPGWKVEPFKLDDATDKNPDVCPALHRRLNAQKLAKLAESTEAAFVTTLVAQALALAGPEDGFKPVHVIGIVVNRVRTARQVAELLRAEYRNQQPLPEGESDHDRPDVVLLTGRIRPYDRDELLFRRPVHDARNPGVLVHGLLPFVKASANKEQTDYDRPPPPRGVLFVVATQTVEVGADFSFDALVTELSPLDALRQRFGRVDRLGFRERSRIVIVRNKEADKDDPVYGTAPGAVWKLLKEWEKASKKAKEIDFGIEATEARLPPPAERATFLAPLCAPSACAPVMMPAHADDWVQTSVAPEPDPDPALFLHGPQSGPADVSVVWRADVSQDLLARDIGRPDAAVSGAVVALVPPTSIEALSLPIWHVRNWLRDRTKVEANFTDLEGEPEPDPGRQREHPPSAPFLIWKGPDRPDRTKPNARRKDRDRTRASDDPDDIRPGNTIVVPASYGGCDEFGWNPEHGAAVCDVADDCSWRAKRRPVLRVHPASQVHQETFTAWRRLSSPFPAEVIELLPSLLRADPDTGETDWDEVARGFRGVRGDFDWLPGARRVGYPDGTGVALVGRGRKPHPDDPNDTDTSDEAPADDEGTNFLGTGGWVWLEDHCRKVQRRVDAFARALALSTGLGDPVSRAALLHDAGKADPRFQSWLYGSDAEAARAEFQLIAKSRTEAQNAAAVEAARKRAGWPKGGRHEAASVLLARSNPDAFAGISDPELLEYLIGAHHGRGRPLWPFTEDDTALESPGAVPVALGGFKMSADLPPRPESALMPLHAGWVDLFWRLVRRYGYWGLAYLETLLVLADHRQSEAERNQQPEAP